MTGTGRIWLVAGCILSLAFLFYGSLVPLNYEARPFSEAWQAFLRLASQPSARVSRTDLATNFLLTVPLAFFGLGMVAAQRRSAQIWGRVCLVWIVCLAASMFIEFIQHFFPGRTPSASDILMQSLGAVAGIAVWWIWGSRLWGRFFAHASSREALTLTEKFLWLYLIVLFGFNIMPLDLAVSPVEIYHKWTGGRINLIPFGYAYKGGVSVDTVYGIASDLTIWIPAGVLLALAGKKSPTRAWRWLVMAALLLEFFQLFVFSRVTDVTDILTAAAGSGLGILIAARIRGTPVQEQPFGVAGRSDIVRHAIQGLALYFLWTVVLTLFFWFPFDFRIDRTLIGARLSSLTDFPFYSYFYGTEFRALTAALRKILFFIPLGVSLAWAVRSSTMYRFRGALTFVALVLCGTAAAGIELGQVLLPDHVVDSGDLVLTTLGGMLGYWGARAVFRRGSADRLTAGLTHGSEPPDRPDSSHLRKPGDTTVYENRRDR